MNNLDFDFNGETLTAQVAKSQNSFTVSFGDKEVQLEPLGDNLYAVSLNGTKYQAAVVASQGKYFVDIDSMLFEISDPQAETVAGGSGGHGGEKDKIFAPMPGKIVKLMVAGGDVVKEKQAMVIVEAMKMENQVLAMANGKVKAINFGEGDQVDTETPIIELELDE